MKKKSKQLNKILTLASQGQLNTAFKLLRKQLKSKKDPEIWVKLASLCASSGLNKECVSCCQCAIEKDPEYALAYSYLGKVYIVAGDTTKALDATKRAVLLKEDDALIRFHAGYVYHTIERFDLALKHFLISLDLDPSNTMAHAMTGSCYQAIGDADKLVKHFELSLELTPTFVDSMIRLGSHYQSLGDFVRAEGYFDRALSIMPDAAPLLDKKANLLAVTGKKEKAYIIIRGLIDSHKETSSTLSTYAGLCSKYGSVAECIELSEKFLNRMGINDSDKRNLGYALGKIYDGTGEYDLAMGQYHTANKLFYGKFNIQSHIDFTSNLIDMYSDKFYVNAPRVNEGINKPIFIIGMPRSGTSLIEQVLSQHDTVFAGGELPYMTNILREVSGADATGYSNMGFVKNLNKADISSLADEYLNRINLLSNDSERVTDKMPSNYTFLGLISQMFPDAKILHCKRDPRDTCLSIYFQNFGVLQPYSSDLNGIAKVYLEYDRLMRHWTDVLNIDVCEVRYEELVADLENRARDILKYCDLEWQDECLSFYKSKRNVATASFDQVNKPIYTKSLARWKNYEKHLGELEEIFEPVL